MSSIRDLQRKGQNGPADLAAIVLAGSHGWGGSPGRGLPRRPLADVALRPLISYALEWLSAADVARVTICANGSTSPLEHRLGGSFGGVPLTYRADLLPRGAAGCIRDAATDDPAATFLVVEGTVIPRLNATELLAAHARSGAVMTVVTTPHRVGTDLQPAGIYVMQREALDAISANGFQDIKESVIPRLYRDGATVTTYAADDECPRVADLESYLAINHWMVTRLVDQQRSAGMPLAREVVADNSATIDDSAMLVGPVMVGARSRISAGATIVGPAVIGDDVRIEAGALVSRSVLGRGSVIAADAMVHGSIVVDGAVIASGSQLFARVGLIERPRTPWLRRLFPGTRKRGVGEELAPREKLIRSVSPPVSPKQVRPETL